MRPFATLDFNLKMLLIKKTRYANTRFFLLAEI